MHLDFSYKDLDFISKSDNKINLDWHRLWSNRGHTLGEGMISPDGKYFYLNIPKNSSSFIKKCLTTLNWQYSNVSDHPDAKIIVALRDPTKRWVSGVSEYLFMYHTDVIDNIADPFNCGFLPLLGDKLGISLLFGCITFDDHTERQSLFLKDIDLNRCVWLFVDKDFSKTFSQLLSDLGYKNDFEDTEKENSTDNEDEYRKKKLNEVIKLLIDNDEYKQYNLKQWFWCDQELIDTVEFYGR